MAISIEAVIESWKNMYTIDEIVESLIKFLKENPKNHEGVNANFGIKTKEGKKFAYAVSDYEITPTSMDNLDLLISGSENVIMDVFKQKISPAKALIFKGLRVSGDLGILKKLNIEV